MATQVAELIHSSEESITIHQSTRRNISDLATWPTLLWEPQIPKDMFGIFQFL